MLSYQLWLLIHLGGVVTFLGTFILAFVSKTLAERSRDPVAIAHAFAAIRFADRWIMPPSVTTLMVSGFALAAQRQLSLASTGWVFWPAVLVGLSGAVFLLRVHPLQKRLEQVARDSTLGTFDWPSYRSSARSWLLWAILAFVANIVAMALMVLKPHLPAF